MVRDETPSDSSSSILIVYEGPESLKGSKGLGAATALMRQYGRVDPTILGANLQEFCSCMMQVIDGIQDRVGTFNLEKVEVSAEVTAEGEVRFIGGISAGIKGGIQLVFTRKTPESI